MKEGHCLAIWWFWNKNTFSQALRGFANTDYIL